MKKITKSIFALAASLFLTNSKANSNDINSRVINIRKSLSELSIAEKSKNEISNNLLDYFVTNHDLKESLNAEKTDFASSWVTWHNNPNWATWTNWNTWNNWNTWHTWDNWHTWHNWNNY